MPGKPLTQSVAPQPVQTPAVSGSYILMLIGGNLISILGVVLWDWDALLILVLYWIETGIIGMFTLVKILLALPGYRPIIGRSVTYRQKGKDASRNFTTAEMSRWSIVPLFVTGYLGAMVFVAVLAGSLWRPQPNVTELYQQSGMMFALGLGLLFVDQAMAFWKDYFGGPDWARSDPVFHMWRPAGRFAMFYFLLLIGTPLAMATGQPAVLVVFIVLKTLSELMTVPFAASDWSRSPMP